MNKTLLINALVTRKRLLNGAIHLLLITLVMTVGYLRSYAQAPLCSSGATQFGYEYISSVTINGATVQGANDFVGPGYFDYTGSNMTSLVAGNTYNVSVTVNTNDVYQEYVKMWIDFNGNGDLQDAGELVFDQNYTFNGTQVYSGTVTIPNTAYNGSVYIRTILVYSSAPTICGSYDYGATIDCKATITGGVTPRKLTIATSGTGNVTSSPAGINTASSINSADFAPGSNISLTATATGSASFVGWTGSVTSNSNPLTVTMNADKNITATFATAPILTTTAASGITSASATSGGNVTSDGGSSVTARGVCWNTTGSPTTSNSKTSDGTGVGSFSSTLAGLSPGTTYHLRAYATNGAATTYGNEITFATSAATAITLSPSSLTSAAVGNSYNTTINSSGGTGPYTYAITTGALPAGLTLSSAGVLSGTPTATGTFNFTIAATDAGSNTGSQAYSLTVNAPTITLSPGTLPNASSTLPYSRTLTASGGTSSYIYAVTAGALPTGITLATNGTLSGTATQLGTFNFTITATDSSTGAGPYAGSQAYTLTVTGPTITVSPTTIPAATVGTLYGQTLTSSGGTAPYTYTVTAGTLPAGLTLGSGGIIAGTPTGGGTFNFTITSSDNSTGAGPYTASQTYTLTVNAPAIIINPPQQALSASPVLPYNQTQTASGGTAPYTFAITSGALPAGITMASDGTLSGTATVLGTFNFTVTATDNSTGTGPYTQSIARTLTVSGPIPTLVAPPLPAAKVGVAYSFTFTASGANNTPPYTFSKSAGTLPPGLTLASDGSLSGTPTAVGTYLFQISATDNSPSPGPYTGSRLYTGFTVSAPTIVVGPPTIPDGTAGVAYSQTIAATGGTAPYTYAVTAGALPAGITLAADGTLSGTTTVTGTFNFTVTATDATTGIGAPYTASTSYSLNFAAPTITLMPATIPDGTAGVVYSQTITASGGTAPYTYAVTAGSLPAGLTLSPSTGAITGTPTAIGAFNFVVTATDGLTFTGSQAYALIVNAPTITLSPTTLSDGTYQSAYPTVTFTAGGGTSPYTYSAAGLPPGMSIDATTGVLSGTPTAADTYSVAVTAQDASTGTGAPFTKTNFITLVIDKVPLTITANANNKTYGAAIPVLTASYSGFVGGDTQTSLTTAPTLTTTATSASPVGTYPITVSGALAANYAVTYVGAILQVTPAALTIIADDQSKVYGSANPSLTASYSGFVNGDTQASLTTLPTLTTTATASSSVGNYTITASGAVDANYSISYTAGNLEVSPMALTITADAQSKNYGDADPSFTYQITSGSLVGTDAFAGSLTRDAGENVGTYAIRQGSLALSSNYTLAFTGANLAIGTRSITVTADAQSKNYGDADPALTYQVTSGSLVGTDAFTGSLTRDAGENVGTYAIRQGSLALSSNYTLAFTGANLTIGTRSITVTADAQSKNYGDADPALTYQVTSGSLVGTDAFTGSLTRDAGENAGTYAIRQGSLALSSNYTLTYTGANLAIGTRAITVTADAQSKNYGDADPSLTYQITSGSLVGTDAFAGSLTRDAGENVGAYAIRQGSLALSSNYALAFTGSNLTINKTVLIITASDLNRAYGQANPALTLAYTGFVNSDDATKLATQPIITTTATTNSAIGIYPITVSGAVSPNYSISYVPGTLTITAATITVTADNQTKSYGSANPVLTAHYRGFVNGDDASKFTTIPSLTTTASVTSGAGDYIITASGAVIPNYIVVYQSGVLTVNKALLTITVDNQSRAYGTSNPELTIRYSGFVNGDDVSKLSAAATASTVAVGNTPPGIYPITATGAASPNYTFSYVPGTLTIVPLTDASLSGLLVNQGRVILSPDFASDVYNYSATVDNQVDRVNVTALFGSASTAQINGNVLYNNNPSGDILLHTGNNSISIIVTAQDGSQHTYSISIYRGLPASLITATNILTPNGDGKNDTWMVKDINLYPDNMVSVYDRAGRLVYSKHGYQNDWDGTLKGSPLEQGTYFFTIDLGNGGNLIKGFISIIREQ